MPNKFQPFDFENMQEMLNYLGYEHKIITMILHDIIMEQSVKISYKLSFNVPFYFIKKNICYIWPGDIPWGKTNKRVVLGFPGAKKMKPEFQKKLLFEKRKNIGILAYENAIDIDLKLVKDLVLEAIAVHDLTLNQTELK